MTNGVFGSVGDLRDVEALRYYDGAVAAGEDPGAVLEGLRAMGRDNARTPVQWDSSENAGFTSGAPWIGVTPNYREVNAAAQVGDPGSVHSYYRALIAIRHRLRVVALGSFERLDAGDPRVFAYRRALGEDRLLVVVNLSSDSVRPALADGGGLVQLLGNADETKAPCESLGPWEARVYLG